MLFKFAYIWNKVFPMPAEYIAPQSQATTCWKNKSLIYKDMHIWDKSDTALDCMYF